MLKITENAKTKIKQILGKHPRKLIRVVMGGFGWGGPRMGITLDELNKDEVYTYNGINILIDAQTKSFLSPSIIDWEENSLFGSGLVVRSKNATC